jgi:signal peptidase I
MRAAMSDIITETPPKAKSETRDFLQFLLKLGIFVFILRSFIFAPFSIPSESMVPRLRIGDYLIVTKWSYGYSRYSFPWALPLIQGPGRMFGSVPERGDVVVFKKPPENDPDYIKRVIGLPGDFIQMKGGVLFINGTAVKKEKIGDAIMPVTPNMIAEAARTGRVFVCNAEKFEENSRDGGRQCRYPQYRETLPGGKSYNVIDMLTTAADDTQLYTVPQGQLLMMGDNRDNSADSRLEAGGFGFVPMENLVGKARFTVFSTDGSASWVLPWTWFTAARTDRIGDSF